MSGREEGPSSPEECDKELHQIHEVTVLGEGDLQRNREDTFRDAVTQKLSIIHS